MTTSSESSMSSILTLRLMQPIGGRFESRLGLGPTLMWALPQAPLLLVLNHIETETQFMEPQETSIPN